MLKTNTILTTARKHLNIDRVRSHSLHTHGHFSLSTHTLSRPSNRYWSRPSNSCWIRCGFRTCSGESTHDRLLLNLWACPAGCGRCVSLEQVKTSRLFSPCRNAAFRVCGKDGTFFTSWHLWHPFYVTWSTSLPISCSPRAGVSHRWAWRSLVRSDFLTAATKRSHSAVQKSIIVIRIISYLTHKVTWNDLNCPNIWLGSERMLDWSQWESKIS